MRCLLFTVLLLGMAIAGAGGVLLVRWCKERQHQLTHPPRSTHVVPDDFRP